MRLYGGIFFLLFLLAFISCRQKYSAHELRYAQEQTQAQEIEYINFLIEQVEEYPDQDANYLKLAQVYADRDENSKAIAVLQKAELNNPASVDVLLDLAFFHANDENIDQLSRILTKLGELVPDDIRFLKLSARHALLLGDFRNAIFYTNRALLTNPFDHDSYVLNGDALLSRKDSIGARLKYEEALKMKETSAILNKLYKLELEMGEYDKARKHLIQLSNYSNLKLYYEWGEFYNAAGDIDSSRMCLMNYYHENPASAKVKFELARNYYKANLYDSSLFFINEYINDKPNAAAPYVLKAKVFEKRYQYTSAKKLYTQALELDSANILARKGLDNLERKVAYLQLQRRKQALQEQEESLQPQDIKEIN